MPRMRGDACGARGANEAYDAWKRWGAEGGCGRAASAAAGRLQGLSDLDQHGVGVGGWWPKAKSWSGRAAPAQWPGRA